MDGLGRTVKVSQNPGGLGYQTWYYYDALGDLVSVNNGGQYRNFAYDSLGRLTQATNPESGLVTYNYDAASNLINKLDNRGITTVYHYDALNRMIRRSSTDSSISSWYSYDQTQFSNALGRLTQIAELGGHNPGTVTTYENADPVGNVLQSAQSINNVNYNFSYSYNLAGALTGETYPSGRNLQITYDGQIGPLP